MTSNAKIDQVPCCRFMYSSNFWKEKRTSLCASFACPKSCGPGDLQEACIEKFATLKKVNLLKIGLSSRSSFKAVKNIVIVSSRYFKAQSLCAAPDSSGVKPQ